MWKSWVEIEHLHASIMLPHFKCCSAQFPLRAGLKCTMYEPRPQWKFFTALTQSNVCLICTQVCHTCTCMWIVRFCVCVCVCVCVCTHMYQQLYHFALPLSCSILDIQLNFTVTSVYLDPRNPTCFQFNIIVS